jgi:hypothetical protein
MAHKKCDRCGTDPIDFMNEWRPVLPRPTGRGGDFCAKCDSAFRKQSQKSVPGWTEAGKDAKPQVKRQAQLENLLHNFFTGNNGPGPFEVWWNRQTKEGAPMEETFHIVDIRGLPP